MRLAWFGYFGLSVISASICGLAVGFTRIPVRAQVTINPNIVEVEARRGRGQSYLTIINNGEGAFRARIRAIPFTYDRDSGFRGLLESHPEDLTPYLQFTPRELEVEPGTSRRVRLLGRLAPSLPEGEYRSALIVENLQPVITTDSQGNRVQIVQQTAIIVFLHQGDLQPDLNVAGAIWNPQTRKITILVQNVGGASARPGLEWRLLQAGTEIDGGTISPQIVLARGDRNLTITYPEGEETPPPGNYQLQGELVWHEDNYRQQKTESFQIDLMIE